MFDNVCKFLTETFPTDFAAWLLGEPIIFTQLSPSELSLEPIRADALILLESENLVLHLEFQTQPKALIPFRMIDYRLRTHRRFPDKQMKQTVVYLKQTGSELVMQTTFTLEKTHHEFEVIRLWEQPTSTFLENPGLLPFAVLTQTDDKTQTLIAAAREIKRISNSRLQGDVAASAAILAGLVLSRQDIQRIIRSDLMQESVIYQDLLAQGEAKGKAEALRQVAITLLNEGMTIDAIARVTGLSIDTVQQLQNDHQST